MYSLLRARNNRFHLIAAAAEIALANQSPNSSLASFGNTHRFSFSNHTWIHLLSCIRTTHLGGIRSTRVIASPGVGRRTLNTAGVWSIYSRTHPASCLLHAYRTRVFCSALISLDGTGNAHGDLLIFVGACTSAARHESRAQFRMLMHGVVAKSYRCGRPLPPIGIRIFFRQSPFPRIKRILCSSMQIGAIRTKDFSRQNLPGEMLWFWCLVQVWRFGIPRPSPLSRTLVRHPTSSNLVSSTTSYNPIPNPRREGEKGTECALKKVLCSDSPNLHTTLCIMCICATRLIIQWHRLHRARKVHVPPPLLMAGHGDHRE